MYMLIYIIAVVSIYITSFRNDFKDDNINKVAPVLIVTIVLIGILAILASLLKGA